MTTVFLGDSHACGYMIKHDKPTYWNGNNYAELYAEHYNKPVVVYGMPGGCNRKYPSWVKTVLDRYTDIDEIFIQSTYWNRHLIGINTTEQPFVNSLDADYFAFGPNKGLAGENINPLVDRWIDIKLYEGGTGYGEISHNHMPDHYVPFKGLKWNAYHDNDFKPVEEKYYYTKLWFELLTHLQYRDYCQDLFTIDRLCEQRGIKWHLWAINDRVFIPDNPYYYGDLTNLQTYNIVNTRQWFKDNKGIDIDTPKYRVDDEHYTTDVHRTIATEYFEHLQNAKKSTVNEQYINRQLNTESALPDIKIKSDTPL